MNVMLLFIPLAIMGRLFDLGGVFTFVCSALSCVPLSYRLGQATEEVGTRLGPVTGGLLNATFGNAAELIISIAALNHGLLIIVRMTIIGSILGQLLLVLGTSLLLAGLKYRELSFSRALIQTNFTLIVIAMLAIGLPSVLVALAPEKAAASASFLTPALSILLLLIYGTTVVFTLRRQPREENEEGPNWPLSKGLILLVVSTGGIVVVSELLVSSILPFVEATDISQVFIGLIVIPLFGNVVDHIVAISVALKNKMDMSMTISVGSAAQVACMVLPAIVLASMVMGRPLGLIFAPVELLSLGVGVLLMIPVLLDGFSNWLEGAQLLTCYTILALVLWAL
jgi:Ca2+:H+ antiporter